MPTFQVKRTRLMKLAERRVGMPIDAFFMENWDTLVLQGCADKFGVCKATAWYWSKTFYLRNEKHMVRMVALEPEREPVAP